MTPAELQVKLEELKSLPAETEWVEFKLNDHGSAAYPEIGEYVSAIANSLALLRRERGYIVWGINNVTHELEGTDFKPRRAKIGNEELENWLTHNLHPQIRFWIFEGDINGKHFVLFEIGAASHTPVRFRGEEFIRIGSLKKKLKDHTEKERELWKVLSEAGEDWSAQICDGATLNDLEPKAIAFARQEYKKKNPNLAAEVDGWNDETFLNKAKVCIGGKVTRTAIILVGRPEADHFLGNCHPQLSWILKDKDGLERDYKHFSPPFLLAVDALLGNVRNLTCRVLPWGTLFPTEILQYDPWVLRESLHNAIAHQDYPMGGRINIVEFEDRLVIVNKGAFLPGDVESVIRRDAPFSVYRNAFLAQAMVNLQMIDTIGSGIKRIFQAQKKRSFPMPDYDLSEPNEVKVVISNKVLDERYTRMLLARADLDLWDVITLDKVQKGKPLTEEEFKAVKAKKLVEGRRPNLFVSAEVAAATDTVEDYLNKRGIDKAYCKKMVVELLEKKGEAKREDIDGLLRKKLSDALTEDQRTNSIRNLLQEMRREGTIERVGSSRGPNAAWRLAKTSKEDAD